KSQNHADLAKKKIMYFNEFIRNRYHLQQPFNEEEQILILSRKSGVEQGFISKLLQVTGNWEQKNTVDRHELSELNIMIEEFYKKCK
ncbi:MAG: hypothetical protein JXA72_02920, partial [Bacteroidales bacterium]|nr:hypothetical protein [Bacteroidales bacterium]